MPYLIADDLPQEPAGQRFREQIVRPRLDGRCRDRLLRGGCRNGKGARGQRAQGGPHFLHSIAPVSTANAATCSADASADENADNRL